MRPLHALAPHSEIVVSTRTPKHDRRLSDKILAAFGHAYAEGALGVAAVLRRAMRKSVRRRTTWQVASARYWGGSVGTPRGPSR